MFFYMPTKIYEEVECVKNHAKELCSLGKHAFIVTGKSSAFKNGSYDDVCAVLDAHGIEHTVFNEVEENPCIETVMNGRDKAVRCGADFVIGIGGGSPLDAAKAIALMAYHKEKDSSYMYEKGADSKALPIVEVPTTCGTGSESTAVSVITNHAKKTKGSIAHKIFPALSLIDGKYLYNAPVSVICNTAIDSLSHLYERLINVTQTDYSKMCVASGLKIWASVKNVLKEKRIPDEKEAFALMRASTLGGMSIAHTGTGLPHALSYDATYFASVPHGKAVGYYMAGYLSESPKEKRDFVLELSGFKNLDEFALFYKDVCNAERLPDDILESSVKSVVLKPEKLATAPFFVDEAVVRRIANYY